ncbi:VOC family protein [Anaerocolumna sp. AGMB13025]|uniref:VOC family protein n=1 Tax=Anaerocolumna sp. AGMB13025 TaxID=3039116 RepID=UPI00241FCF0D|nr:VOC family protein [Anaerocolumna sp. AGMB13025]WFR57257.1 VOC family protein [Anaerocolumna sp. AGMB13025]
MLIPHLHFDGNCLEAIDVYEKAFNTKVDTESIDYMSDGKKIAHAIIKIHGTEVFLNDALKFINDTFDINCGAHLIITFNSVDELLVCYEILKSDDKLSPFYETSYSKLVGNFKDKFGVLWGFMVTA